MASQLDRLQAALSERYAIVREVGSGGMATVYLAEDTRHHRRVAIKVLRPELAATVGVERFLREIEIAAQLQHPNILALLDSGEADGFLYYVMPFVEGPSLGERIAEHGELPIHDAVKILIQVTDALAEAHGKGIIHRDIKPANVLLSGRNALVTDFGVAKAVNEAAARQAVTTVGVALGTPTYMAPEQASAEANIDQRVDIYAVGVMAYEMLTGQPPFAGSTYQAILAAHITEAPRPLREVRPSVSEALDQTVLKCLEKRAADRWQSADELVSRLEAVATPSSGVTPRDVRPVQVTPGRPWVRHLGWGLAAAGVAAAAALLGPLRPGGPPPPITFGPTRQITLEDGLEMDPDLSPDGRFIAHAAGLPGRMRVYVRSVSGGNPVEVSGGLAGDHRMPRWSPDGSQVLFTAPGGIYVVPALGGAPRLVVPSVPGRPSPRFATWAPDGRRIAYVESDAGIVGRGAASTTLFVTEIGGTSRRVSETFDIHTPSWSPDGRFIAYVSGNSPYLYDPLILGNLAPSSVMVVPADGGEPIQITGGTQMHMSPVWTPDGRNLLLVSTRDGGRDIYRIPLRRDGSAAAPMERLTTGLSVGTIALSVDGRSLAYTVFPNAANIWAVPIPATGAVSVRQAEAVTTGTQHVESLSISPDRRWITFDSDRGGNVDIYKMPLAGGPPVQLTTDPREDFFPAWSPDGREIAFHSLRDGQREVYVISGDGTAEVRVTDHPAQDLAPDWSPDGRSLAFSSDRSGQREIYTVERSGPSTWGAPRQLTTQGAGFPEWAPDGQRILHAGGPAGVRIAGADGTGDRELLRPFLVGGEEVEPTYAVWAPDGRSIYFMAGAADAAGIWSLPATGGTPRLVVRFDDPDRVPGRDRFKTDGERLYFTLVNRQSDIWVMNVEPGR